MRTHELNQDATPFVTVIMPVQNEERFIARSLGAVLNQDYPEESMEVVIADGRSTDNTRGLVEGLAKNSAIRVTIVDNPGKIVSCGINLAVKQALGSVIVRVDGHCEIARDYVSRCVDSIVQEGVDGVGGPIETIGATPIAQTIAAAMSSKFGVGGSSFRTVKDRTMLVDTIPFPAYKRSTMQDAGPYDEELVRNQDDEYNYRLRKMGAKLLLDQNVRARYFSRSDLRSLWHQYYQYGYWKVRVMQKHPLQMRARQFVPPIFVLVVVTLTAFAMLSGDARMLLSGLLLSYAVVAVACSLILYGSDRNLKIGWLPLVFAVLHFSYGFGFLSGLLRFWNRWGDRESARIVPMGLEPK